MIKERSSKEKRAKRTSTQEPKANHTTQILGRHSESIISHLIRIYKGYFCLYYTCHAGFAQVVPQRYHLHHLHNQPRNRELQTPGLQCPCFLRAGLDSDGEAPNTGKKREAGWNNCIIRLLCGYKIKM